MKINICYNTRTQTKYATMNSQFRPQKIWAANQSWWAYYNQLVPYVPDDQPVQTQKSYSFGILKVQAPIILSQLAENVA